VGVSSRRQDRLFWCARGNPNLGSTDPLLWGLVQLQAVPEFNIRRSMSSDSQLASNSQSSPHQFHYAERPSNNSEYCDAQTAHSYLLLEASER
jgi:hypothetical protein